VPAAEIAADAPMECCPDVPERLTRARVNGLGERLALIAAFARAAAVYWLEVFPRTWLELRRWRSRAARIADPAPRRVALDALDKRGNLEGAAAFAAFVPRRRRGQAVRALVAFQAAYNYADLLAEQPNAEPVANARRLHEALLVALDPDAPHRDYLADCPGGDGGYLVEIVDACRAALRGLPFGGAAAAAARRAAARIVAFQALSQGGRDELERWARSLPAAEAGLAWWEAAASAGSSLGVHVLIMAAATPGVCDAELADIEAAYFPWIGALHSLLDSLVDESEDLAQAQLSLVGLYRSREHAATRLRWLAARALAAAGTLPGARRHQLLVAALACHYLSDPEIAPAWQLEPADTVRQAGGAMVAPTLALFRARRLAAGC
jgi:tetraprenyl-beta-curcumene synthase